VHADGNDPWVVDGEDDDEVVLDYPLLRATEIRAMYR